MLITRGRKSPDESGTKKKGPSRLKSRWLAVGAGLVIAGVALSGCTSGGGGGNGPGKSANTATYALPPATVPNFIWPFEPPADYSVINSGALQQLLFRPLYWFGNNKGQPLINDSLSLAQEPVFSNGGKTITVKLKPYKWSNGETVTSQDVEFWYNMAKAEKTKYAAYVAGQFPDNVTSVTTPNSSTIVFNTDHEYSQQWFLYNQLSQITPMPKAWDKTSASAAGTCMTDVSGCPAVFNYLNSAAKDLPTYATSPIWKVVDGPWSLKSFNADGHASFVPNKSYSGPIKAKLSQFNLAPYTTDTAQFNVLRAGQTIDVGYIPTQDIAQPKSATSAPDAAGPNPLKNYNLVPQFLYGINYFPYNFNNPTVGPIFKQLYFRQAFQSLVDQGSVIKSQAKNYGVETTGPIPLYPDSPLISQTEKNNPYPFSISKAKSYLSDNGWTVVPGGTTTCTKPGTGTGECGADITQGEALTFSLPYASGQATIDAAMQSLKSDASKVGITLNLTSQPFDTVTGEAVKCTPDSATCKWQIANWGGGWVYANDYYPTGESIFSSASSSNSGSYNNPSMDTLINNTTTQTGTPVLQKYEDALSKDLPVVWQPNYTYSLTEIAKGLNGVTPQSAFGILTPEQWSWK